MAAGQPAVAEKKPVLLSSCTLQKKKIWFTYSRVFFTCGILRSSARLSVSVAVDFGLDWVTLCPTAQALGQDPLDRSAKPTPRNKARNHYSVPYKTLHGWDTFQNNEIFTVCAKATTYVTVRLTQCKLSTFCEQAQRGGWLGYFRKASKFWEGLQIWLNIAEIAKAQDILTACTSM